MKLPGAKEVKFAVGKKPNTQQITFVSEKEGVTKEEAVKSLGKRATRFVVTAWTDPNAPKPEGETEEAKDEKKEPAKG
jgi:hypothetical protein